MDICLDGIGHLVIDDQTDVLYIDTTTRKVSCDQDICIAGTQ